MERGKLWRNSYGNNLRLLEMNSVGLTPDLAAQRPAEGVSSAAWLLGHVVAARRSVVKLLGGSPPEDPAWAEHYSRGGSGATAHLAWPELVLALQAVDQQLKEAFMSETDWDRPARNPGLGIEQPLEQVVAFMFMHECYHMGQIGIIRKLLGLPGAI